MKQLPMTQTQFERAMIRDSAYFQYDENLAEYYDYKRYGRERMDREYGQFNGFGYISHHGTLSLDQLMSNGQSEHMEMQMGDMS